jgi:hypothetical protein
MDPASSNKNHCNKSQGGPHRNDWQHSIGHNPDRQADHNNRDALRTYLFHLVAAMFVARKVLLAGKVALDNSWNCIDGLSEYPSLEAFDKHHPKC